VDSSCGLHLWRHGFANVEILSQCQDRLHFAKKAGFYAKLHRQGFENEVDEEDESFNAVIFVDKFVNGGLKPNRVIEAARLLKKRKC